MIDQAFEQMAMRLVEWCNTYMPELLNSASAPELSVLETQVGSIKIILEALAIALAIWLGNTVRAGSKKKSKTQTSKSGIQSKEEVQTKYGSGKGFTPPKWKKDGRYWDEKKKKWIDPDYVSKSKK